MLAAACWMGCTPKLNDGISPTQPAYTGTSFPNPLVLFNGQFAPGVGLIPGSNTVFLTPFCSDYSYDAGITIAIGNTTVTPIQGNGNLVFGVSTYDQSGGAVNCTSFFADLPVEPLDSSGNTTTVNLTSGGYTQATFEAMAQGFSNSVTQVITFEAAGNSTAFPLTSAWAPCTVALGSLTSVNVLFEINVAPPAALPVTVYVDNLVYH